MKIFVLAACLLLATPPAGEEPSALMIRVLDLVPSRGEVVIALFDSPGSFDARTPALRSATLPVDGEACEWRLDGLAPGEYAAVAYQDLNGNGVVDKGRLGIPKEPYGFSNDARAALGPPSFDQARFIWEGGAATLEMRLTRRSAKIDHRLIDQRAERRYYFDKPLDFHRELLQFLRGLSF